MSKSELEILFANLCDEAEFPPYEREYRFHATRKWRLDFAWPDQKIGVELNGGQWIKGGHNTGGGTQRDAEKNNSAQFLGWRVFTLVNNQLLRDVDYRNQFFADLKAALNPTSLLIVPEKPTLTVGKFTFAGQGLDISATPSFEEFDVFGQLLTFFDRTLDWSIGDFWNAAHKRFRDEALQLFSENGMKLKTVQNKGSVCKKFPASRRRETLHFSHHAAVAGLETPDQERLLDNATERGWTVPQLRLAVRKWKQDKLDGELFDDPRAVLGYNVEKLSAALTDLWGIVHNYPGMELTLSEMQNGIDGLALFHDAVQELETAA